VGHDRRGVPFALGAAVLFGLSTPLAKGLLHALPPQMLAGLLYVGAGVGLGLSFFVQRTRRGPAEARLGRSDAPWLAGSILAGGVAGPFLLMLGLSSMAASGASLLLNLEGVFTALLAWFVFRENVDRRIALGMAAIVLGGALLSWEGQVAWGGVTGPLAVAGACLAWGLDNNLTQKISASDPVQITAIKGCAAGAVNVGLALALGSTWPGGRELAGALGLGLLSYGVSLALYVRALRELGTARTGAYFSIAPFVGAVVAVLVWHDPVTPLLVAAAALMGVGVWIHLTERHQHEHTHEALEHEHWHVDDEHHQHQHQPGDPLGEPHSHRHQHEPMVHTHPHYPEVHHRHPH
jgi:drug/metabolite transporter (DMT)-like permease